MDVTDTFYSIKNDVKGGYGTQLLVGVGNGSPETFVAVKGVVSLALGSLDTSKVKITHLRSPRKANEYRSGMRDFGGFAIKCRWLPDDQTQSNDSGNGSTTAPGLLNLSVSGLTWNFVIRLNDGSPETEYPFSGFVSKFQPGAFNENDDSVDLDVEIMPSEDYTAALP